jgi:hypothetical protein
VYLGHTPKLRVTEASFLFKNPVFEPTAIIIDEADRIIDNHSYEFKKNEEGKLTTYGLAAAGGAHRIYFLSATYEDYHRVFLEQCFQLTAGITKYWSQVEIS